MWKIYKEERMNILDNFQYTKTDEWVKVEGGRFIFSFWGSTEKIPGNCGKVSKLYYQNL
jgi:hypothetical protein